MKQAFIKSHASTILFITLVIVLFIGFLRYFHVLVIYSSSVSFFTLIGMVSMVCSKRKGPPKGTPSPRKGRHFAPFTLEHRRKISEGHDGEQIWATRRQRYPPKGMTPKALSAVLYNAYCAAQLHHQQCSERTLDFVRELYDLKPSEVVIPASVREHVFARHVLNGTGWWDYYPERTGLREHSFFFNKNGKIEIASPILEEVIV
jgi:hypothetical protein